MGKLHIGETTELAQRIKAIENANVLKAIDAEDADRDTSKPYMLMMTDED